MSSLINLSGQGRATVFMSANGIHYTAYSELLSKISSSLDISTILYPPLYLDSLEIPTDLSWDYFSNYMDQHLAGRTNLIGIGHSLGGTLLLYNALKYPERFEHLYIIDPALFSPLVCFCYGFLKFMNLSSYFHPMVRLTMKRKDSFDSKDSVFKRWRLKSQFKFFSDQALIHFIDASLIKNSIGTYQLRFPKLWEAAIYSSMCTLDPYIWSNISSLRSKLTVIFGDSSSTFLKGARDKIEPYCAHFDCVKNATHLVPFEYPDQCSQLISIIHDDYL